MRSQEHAVGGRRAGVELGVEPLGPGRESCGEHRAISAAPRLTRSRQGARPLRTNGTTISCTKRPSGPRAQSSSGARKHLHRGAPRRGPLTRCTKLSTESAVVEVDGQHRCRRRRRRRSAAARASGAAPGRRANRAAGSLRAEPLQIVLGQTASARARARGGRVRRAAGTAPPSSGPQLQPPAAHALRLQRAEEAVDAERPRAVKLCAVVRRGTTRRPSRARAQHECASPSTETRRSVIGSLALGAARRTPEIGDLVIAQHRPQQDVADAALGEVDDLGEHGVAAAAPPRRGGAPRRAGGRRRRRGRSGQAARRPTLRSRRRHARENRPSRSRRSTGRRRAP